MNFDNQNRQEVVMLSAAKHLGAHREMLRCAQHDMADLVRESSLSATLNGNGKQSGRSCTLKKECGHRRRDAMMNFHQQDRPWGVMLSAAKHLTRRPPRCFAALSMTPLDQALSMTPLDQFWSFTFIIGSYRILPMVVVKNHHRVLKADEQSHPDAMMNFHKQDR